MTTEQTDLFGEATPPPKLNRYSQIAERIFFDRYIQGATRVDFERGDIISTAESLGMKIPKNVGDLVYSFRYRTVLPASIRNQAPAGTEWIIRSRGRSLYSFVATPPVLIVPNPLLAETKIPDATPGVIIMYAMTDEQALLAKVRYNRLIDLFTGVTCYALQSHLRTTVEGIGQVETDEVYVGVDRRGAHYVFPVQAKGGARDRIGVVQIEQDVAMCAEKFGNLICRPIAAQFTGQDEIALFAFEVDEGGVAIIAERHYRLVPTDDMTSQDLEAYRTRPLDESAG